MVPSRFDSTGGFTGNMCFVMCGLVFIDGYTVDMLCGFFL